MTVPLLAPIYVVIPAAKVAIPASGGTLLDLWNGSTTQILRVVSPRVPPDTITAITATRAQFTLHRTTSIGTGGTGVVPAPFDAGSGFTIDPAITARVLPTGGAAASTLLGAITLDPDEIGQAADRVGDFLPSGFEIGPGITVRPGTGIRIAAVGTSLVGNVRPTMYFAVVLTP